jgi:prevent-host-death family protein
MKRLGAHEARTHLSKLLSEVERGESFAIMRHGREVALLVPARGGAQSLTVAEAIAGLRKFRRGHTLGHTSIRELINDGQRQE